LYCESYAAAALSRKLSQRSHLFESFGREKFLKNRTNHTQQIYLRHSSLSSTFCAVSSFSLCLVQAFPTALLLLSSHGSRYLSVVSALSSLVSGSPYQRRSWALFITQFVCHIVSTAHRPVAIAFFFLCLCIPRSFSVIFEPRIQSRVLLQHFCRLCRLCRSLRRRIVSISLR
jgi:hypothetical protein